MRLVVTIFYSLVIAFLFILSQFFVPVIRDLFKGSLLFLLPFVVFSLLGVALMVATVKKKIKGKLKKFLLLTGASATGILLSILLHNFVYGIFAYFFGPDFWDKIGLGDEPIFFFLTIIVCPAAFLIGVMGSALLLIKSTKWKNKIPSTTS